MHVPAGGSAHSPLTVERTLGMGNTGSRATGWHLGTHPPHRRTFLHGAPRNLKALNLNLSFQVSVKVVGVSDTEP